MPDDLDHPAFFCQKSNCIGKPGLPGVVVVRANMINLPFYGGGAGWLNIHLL